jgi:aryl carrier-like protein
MDTGIRRKLHRITEPQFLFPGSAVVTLLLIWGATSLYLRALRAELEVHSLASTEQILETYEAQVIRSLDEIDQAMNLVTWWRGQGPDRSIAQLTERELLPPELVFGVRVIDAQGRIVDTNQSETASDGASQGYLESLRAGERVVVAYPSLAADGRSTLQFARRLDAPAGEFGGAVIVEVDADFSSAAMKTLSWASGACWHSWTPTARCVCSAAASRQALAHPVLASFRSVMGVPAWFPGQQLVSSDGWQRARSLIRHWWWSRVCRWRNSSQHCAIASAVITRSQPWRA